MKYGAFNATMYEVRNKRLMYTVHGLQCIYAYMHNIHADDVLSITRDM